MGLFSSKNKDGNVSTDLKIVDGLNTFFKKEVIELSVNEEEHEIRIKSKFDKKKPVINLSLDKITRAGLISEKEIVEKSKSVGGRAIAGGLLLGPLGAIVGGMSGIGNKKETKTEYYFVINYTSDNEEKVLSFETVSLTWDKVLKAINKHIITEQKTTEIDL